MQRCAWAKNSGALCILYHDSQWGVPVKADRKLFEMLTLEGAQAGLNWLTVLKRRKNYKQAFDNFDIAKVASYDDKKYQDLLKNEGIIRNKLKIRSVINNAKAIIKLRKEYGSFSKFLWSFVNFKPIINRWENAAEIPARNTLSDMLSKKLKNLGFSFVGSTICYAFMQAVGLINDHSADCFRVNLNKKYKS